MIDCLVNGHHHPDQHHDSVHDGNDPDDHGNNEIADNGNNEIGDNAAFIDR